MRWEPRYPSPDKVGPFLPRMNGGGILGRFGEQAFKGRDKGRSYMKCRSRFYNLHWLFRPRSQAPRDRCAPWRLGGSRSHFHVRDGSGDRPIHRQEDLLSVMAYHERRAVEQAVRRFRRSHLDAQVTAAEQEVEGKLCDPFWQPWREEECSIV